MANWMRKLTVFSKTVRSMHICSVRHVLIERYEVFEMLQAGHAMSEPNVRVSLKRVQQAQYTTLREKLSILVPVRVAPNPCSSVHFEFRQKSCYVYGVVDELGVLKDDEVFVNLCERSGILESKVFVTRFVSRSQISCHLLNLVDPEGILVINHRVSFVNRFKFEKKTDFKL